LIGEPLTHDTGKDVRGTAHVANAQRYAVVMAEIKLRLWDALPRINDFWMVTHYLASVVTTIVLALGTGVLMSRQAPRVFALFNGGREPAREIPEVRRETRPL